MKVINILILNPNTSTKHAKYTWQCDTKGKMNGDGEHIEYLVSKVY
jgi:hypothetical protein